MEKRDEGKYLKKLQLIWEGIVHIWLGLYIMCDYANFLVIRPRIKVLYTKLLHIQELLSRLQVGRKKEKK